MKKAQGEIVNNRINYMIKSTKILSYIFIIIQSSCISKEQDDTLNGSLDIIPKVNTINQSEGYFNFSTVTVFYVENNKQKVIVKQLADLINTSKEFKVKIVVDYEASGGVRLHTNSNLKPEAYTIDINNGGIEIEASTNAGFFYAIQSLRQIFPKEIEKGLMGSSVNLPIANIADSPQFKWRGMMLDVSRHFYNVDEVKNIIDVLAMLKINTFHWHLVDDQGWRIEIKKYPKLTQIGAWRVDQENVLWNDVKENELNGTAEFGGFYTQDDIKEVVEYASSKYVNVVPEIEGVAHVMSAIAAYPELSCKEEKIMVPSGGVWPITDIFCPGKESTFEFVENVLDEVVELFPSKYIHIGGDEATKTNWKTCTHCQSRINNEGLKNEEELQSYMVKRIAKYLQSKNKIMIGWDEILEGGLADDAVVMSWRGVKGGLEAASLKHDVIMSPDTYVYLDHYQGDKKYEPKAIGGFSPLKHVYEFNPIPEGMPVDDQKYILGGQANVWTEYISNNKHLEYMIYPRMFAVSEDLWTSVDNKNWDSFSERVRHMFLRFNLMGINYSKSSFGLRSNKLINPSTTVLELHLFNEYKGTEIRFTTDGSTPTKLSEQYVRPIVIDDNLEIKAQVFEADNAVGNLFIDSIIINKNIVMGADVTYANPYSNKYNSGLEYGLVDGLQGSNAFDDRMWQGWFDEDVEFTVDLNELTKISEINLRFLEDRDNQILLPQSVNIYGSVDGEKYSLIKHFENTLTDNKEIKITTLSDRNLDTSVKSLKVEVSSSTNINTGEKGWTFIDEFVVL